MTRIRYYGPSFVLLAVVVTAMIVGPGIVRDVAFAQEQAEIRLAVEENKRNAAALQLSQAFKHVAEIVQPSVVHISTSTLPPAARADRELRDWFFGPDNRPAPNGSRGGGEDFHRYDQPQAIGNGSGWVYDTGGHIVTNNHVVRIGGDPEGPIADQIVVRFVDGSKYEATVVGTDPSTDIAVLKIDADRLHVPTVAAKPVEQGEIVFAFGSPFQFDFSMSQGIVSGSGRQLGVTGRRDRAGRLNPGYERFIQTDAAINPGNSGGPLVNLLGEVVGMNTAIVSPPSDPDSAARPRHGYFTGVGFAIPAPMIRDVVERLITDGEVRRGYLGVVIEDIDDGLAESYGYEGDGVHISQAVAGRPAHDAGLRAGDILTHLDGRKVVSADDLRYRIGRTAPGTEVELKVWRRGETLTVAVTLDDLGDSGNDWSAGRPEAEPMDARSRAELSFRKLGVMGLRSLAVDPSDDGDAALRGVQVTQVRPGSRAEAAGIGRGMLITAVQGEPVRNTDELFDAIASADTEVIRLRLVTWDPFRNGYRQRIVPLRLPQN